MSGYTKLFTQILDSTVWRENNPTRLLWITMLALKDQDGIVHCTIPGLADRARITIEECEYALNRFQQPDKYSWSQENEGRRITRVDGGWFVINHDKFRSMMSIEEAREKTRLRVARYRARKKECNGKTLPNVTPVTFNASNDIAEAYTDTNTKPNPPNPPSEDLDKQIIEIAKLHPKVLDAFHLSHELSTAIADAVVRDGRDLVFAGTKSMAEAIAKWPEGEKRFIPAPPRYFRESQYKLNPTQWDRSNGNGSKRGRNIDEAVRRALEADSENESV